MSVWTKEAIRAKLETSDVLVERATLAIYARQTADEQSAQTTAHSNGMGFNGTDAFIMSSFAEQILANKYGKAEGLRLSKKQMEIARKKILKYSGQLLEVAEQKATEQKTPAAA